MPIHCHKTVHMHLQLATALKLSQDELKSVDSGSCWDLQGERKWGGGTSGLHLCSRVGETSRNRLKKVFSILIAVSRCYFSNLRLAALSGACDVSTHSSLVCVGVCLCVRVRACPRIVRARLPDAPQPRGAVVPRQQKDNQTDCWIRATKEKVWSVFKKSSLASIAPHFFFFFGIVAPSGDFQQTGMDLPIARQDTPSSSPPKFWLSSLPLDPGAEGSAELWRSICGNWWPHVRTFGDKYMSERLFAALYYISHGVSKLAPSQNYCQCDRSACAAAPEQKDRVCLTHYCKILQQINSFGFKKK